MTNIQVTERSRRHRC